MTPGDIARGLGPKERAAWKDAEWCGDYFTVPDEVLDSLWLRTSAVGLGLMQWEDGDYTVSPLGHAVVFHLRRPSLWQRTKAAVRALLEQESRDE